MAVFPMFVEIEKEVCLIIGGGRVALRKAEVLLDMGAEVHVISRLLLPKPLDALCAIKWMTALWRRLCGWSRMRERRGLPMLLCSSVPRIMSG